MSTETLTPFFAVEKDVEYYNQTKLLDPENARCIALTKYRGNFLYQAWEATDNPLSDPFSYRKTYGQNGKMYLSYESDADNQDILALTTDQIRRGLEKEAVRNWRRAIFLAKKGESILQINPKRDLTESEADCPYAKTQLNIAHIEADNTISVIQVQSYLNTQQSGILLNQLSGQSLLSPESTVDDIIPTIGKTFEKLDLNQVLAQITKIGGQRFDPLQVIEDQKAHIAEQSTIAAENYLVAIERGDSLSELKKLHFDELKKTLPKKVYDDLAARGGGTITSLPSSCGPLGEEADSSVLGSLYIDKDYNPGLCKDCQTYKSKVGRCKICKDCEKKYN